MNQMVSIPVEELIQLAAVDDDFYCTHFFPKTFRQGMPAFSRLFSAPFEDPSCRYVALKMFRGSAKTTRIRARVSKHIAYGLSRTILFVSNAQKHSIYSLRWLKKQIEFNKPWADTFGLKPGSPWSDEIIGINHTIEGVTIYVIALGITGQIRGINLDDFRPDFIVLDDPDNEETTATPEQREKTSDLVFGALIKSLAPPTEAPYAKVALAQTPFNSFDLIAMCEKDPDWRSVEISCFDSHGESSWPARFSTEFLQKEKAQHIRQNKLSLWMREMEVKIVSREMASFKPDWLKHWDVLPDGLKVILAIDPASSDDKRADDQVIGAVGFKRIEGKLNVFVIAYTAEKGEMPDAAVTTFLGYRQKYKPIRAAVESIAYQRVLAWYIEKSMREQRTWLVVHQVQDKRRKSDRIIQEVGHIASDGRLWVHPTHTKLIQQFTEYSPLYGGHDDVLDMVAIAIADYEGVGYDIDGEYTEIVSNEKAIPDLEDWRVAP